MLIKAEIKENNVIKMAQTQRKITGTLEVAKKAATIGIIAVSLTSCSFKSKSALNSSEPNPITLSCQSLRQGASKHLEKAMRYEHFAIYNSTSFGSSAYSGQATAEALIARNFIKIMELKKCKLE